jgi:hypothetical protein
MARLTGPAAVGSPSRKFTHAGSTSVLPSAAGRSKDLGIINIANSGPQVLAPAIAAPLVSLLGGYPTLFLSVAVITTLGSAFVWKIRSVP